MANNKLFRRFFYVKKEHCSPFAQAGGGGATRSVKTLSACLFVFVLLAAGCEHRASDGSEEDNPFAGTWVSTVTGDGFNRTIVMTDLGTWQFNHKAGSDTAGDTKGTYTYNGKTATATASQIYISSTWMDALTIIEAEQATVEQLTVTAEIQSDGKMKVTAFDGTFTYTKQ
jgi:hypothetical protein